MMFIIYQRNPWHITATTAAAVRRGQACKACFRRLQERPAQICKPSAEQPGQQLDEPFTGSTS